MKVKSVLLKPEGSVIKKKPLKS